MNPVYWLSAMLWSMLVVEKVTRLAVEVALANMDMLAISATETDLARLVSSLLLLMYLFMTLVICSDALAERLVDIAVLCVRLGGRDNQIVYDWT